MGCTNCGCSQSDHFDIGGGAYHCKGCGRHCKLFFRGGSSSCYICKRKERERKERERKEREEKERKEKERREKEKKEKERKEKEKKDSKPSMGVVRAGGGKMGINFSKMLAEKLKMAPPGAMKKGAGAPKVDSKPPIMEKTVDMVKLLESQPLQVRKDKKKPAKKVFVLEDE